MPAAQNLVRSVRYFTPSFRARRAYRSLWEQSDIDESLVLVEPQQGRSFNGNMFYIVRTLVSDPRFDSLNILVVYKKDEQERFVALADSYGFDRVKFVAIHSLEYVKALASAKYLITDTAFPPYYIKKEGQIILNTWHGTPLKAMGRSDNSGLHSLGNIQKNLAIADYILFPSKYMSQHIIRDYMLTGISRARILYSGYPRNCAFFDRDRASELRTRFTQDDIAHVYAYMPTWRGTDSDIASNEIRSILQQMDARLDGDELMLVSLHPLQMASVDFSSFKHIAPFPDDIETYEVLSAADLLISDYSSVMFDFAVSGKKIIIFDYDYDVYLKDRGLYMSMDELPFPHARDMGSLFAEMRAKECVEDRRVFLERFCPYESAAASEALCEYVLLGGDSIKSEPMPSDDRKRILIYAGNLARNGITTALFNLIRRVDTSKYHIILTFDTRKVASNRELLHDIPDDVSYIPCMGKANMSTQEKTVQLLYGLRRISIDQFDKTLDAAYRINLRRLYWDLSFHAVIQFNGYDFKKIYQFSKFDCKKIIYIHNDMVQEAKQKGNQRLDMLNYAFHAYDEIGVVSEDILPVTKSIAPDVDKYRVALNLFNDERVRELSKEPIRFDEFTDSTVSVDDIKRMLDGTNTAIVSIGRYSPEKQHRVLIDAFAQLHKLIPDLRLIIIGGGTFHDLYDETVAYVQGLSCSSAIACIRNLSNPYSILAKSDGFILPSKYEGFGLVLLEADVVGVPAVATDIPGPRWIMNNSSGTLVECSASGVYHGLELLANGQAHRLNFDFDRYNADALGMFYEMID